MLGSTPSSSQYVTTKYLLSRRNESRRLTERATIRIHNAPERNADGPYEDHKESEYAPFVVLRSHRVDAIVGAEKPCPILKLVNGKKLKDRGADRDVEKEGYEQHDVRVYGLLIESMLNRRSSLSSDVGQNT